MGNFTIINFNAYRCRNKQKIKEIHEFIKGYEPSIVGIQEIFIQSAMSEFSKSYQVYFNIENSSKDGVGIVTLIRHGITVYDIILGFNGRILGLCIENAQIWNVYPQSGTNFKKEREVFFREELTELFIQWKDKTKYIFQLGDHNCTHRKEDSLHNPAQHLQQGLVNHLQVQGLSDDFIKVHGEDTIMYSRVTEVSKTRIDYIFSNSNSCVYFQYIAVSGLDHCVVLSRYEIDFNIDKERVPIDRYLDGWVISNYLDKDEEFLEQAKFVINTGHLEFTKGKHDPAFVWLKVKTALIQLAKAREKDIKNQKYKKMKILQGFYSSVLSGIQKGEDRYDELFEVKIEMNEMYKENAKEKIDKMRSVQIDDHTFDIHKLQNQKKFEGQGRIKEINIEGIIYTGISSVVNAIEKKIAEEVNRHNNISVDAPATVEEEHFLAKLDKIELTNEEMQKLTGPVEEEEIEYILKTEVDLDSSPGEDGLTYRFIKKFWKWQEFRELYIGFLNYTREIKSMGVIDNIGIMTVKNKKGQSSEYNKKRKLTKLNKDTNLGHGKIWSNRFKDIIIPKILPCTQFNCQKNVNIIDEISQIRDVNRFLLGNKEQNDGTILSIDFKDAFRSISLRWFYLVMERIKVPVVFIDWFKMMYKDLFIYVVINRYRSEKIYVKHGFMEGHPPSMAAFVVSLIPLMNTLEEEITGIVTTDNRIHKIKLFADDLKLFVSKLDDIDKAESIIKKFENVSGLVMHRDPSRGKCQALPFGKHRSFTGWPSWITVKNEVKIVGAMFSNRGELDKLNGNLVSKCFFDFLHKSYGVKGTILQKVYFVNTYLFSKIWFTAQCFKIEKRILENILSKALKFIYAGENERPVRPINFRDKKIGGLGLVNPFIKAKALLIKNMHREFLNIGCDVNDRDSYRNIYGYTEELSKCIKAGVSMNSARDIYGFLINDVICRNNSVIPSRSEKRSENVKWRIAWQNLAGLRGVDAEEYEFAWKLQQDLLKIGARIHRQNAERRCLAVLGGVYCQEVETREHFFIGCERVKECNRSCLKILGDYLGKEILQTNLIHLAFNHRNKQRLRCAVWFAVKTMYKIYTSRIFNKVQLLRELIKEIDWNIKLNRKLGSRQDLIDLRSLIELQR